MSDYPSEWRIETIGDICEIHDSKRIPLSSEQRRDRKGPYPYYGANNIQDSIDDFIFDFDAVLLAEDGGYYDEYETRDIAQYATGRYWVNNHAHILTGSESLDTRFLYFSLVRKNICPWINTGTRAKLNQADLRQIEIAVPPLPEQKKIAEILSGIDKMISAKSIRHEKWKTIAHLILDSVLSNAELRQAPLSDIALLERGKFSHRPRNDPDYYGGEYPFIQTGDIPKTGIRISEHKQTLNIKGLEVSRRFPSGTIVITIAATIGEVGILSYPAWFPDSLVGITPNTEECDPVFLLCSLRRLKDKLLQMAPQSAQSNLNLEILGKLNVPLPPLYEQRKFAQMICCEDERATAEVIGIRKLHDMKAAVASDLLSGRKRVSV